MEQTQAQYQGPERRKSEAPFNGKERRCLDWPFKPLRPGPAAVEPSSPDREKKA